MREGGNVPTCVPKRSAELSCIRCRKLGGAAAKCDSSHSSKEGLRLKRSATHSGLYLRLVWAWLCVNGHVGARLCVQLRCASSDNRVPKHVAPPIGGDDSSGSSYVSLLSSAEVCVRGSVEVCVLCWLLRWHSVERSLSTHGEASGLLSHCRRESSACLLHCAPQHARAGRCGTCSVYVRRDVGLVRSVALNGGHNAARGSRRGYYEVRVALGRYSRGTTRAARRPREHAPAGARGRHGGPGGSPHRRHRPKWRQRPDKGVVGLDGWRRVRCAVRDGRAHSK